MPRRAQARPVVKCLQMSLLGSPFHQSFLWEPSHIGLLAECLQPQK